MGVLANQRHELFAQGIAKGMCATQAYIAAGYSEAGAAQSANRMLRNAQITDRVTELKSAIAESVVQVKIAERDTRVLWLNEIAEKLRTVIRERAADPKMRGVPGGHTGTVVLKTRSVGTGKKQRIIHEAEVDVALLRELRAHEQQAAQELGQWTEKQQISGEVTIGKRLIGVPEDEI